MNGRCDDECDGQCHVRKKKPRLLETAALRRAATAGHSIHVTLDSSPSSSRESTQDHFHSSDLLLLSTSLLPHLVSLGWSDTILLPSEARFITFDTVVLDTPLQRSIDRDPEGRTESIPHGVCILIHNA